jgi:hypothetical protein
MNGLRLTAKACALGALLTLGVAAPALGDEPPPSAQQIRSAAAEYDAGRRAYVDKDYDGAATHFENAFHDAPSAEALRNAIRSRRKAGQLARAATLAQVAALKYPKDAPTSVIVRETLAESQSRLQKVTLTCNPECGLAADGRAISVTDATQTVFFLEPGTHELVVSWANDRSKVQTIAARAGGHDEISMEAPPLPAPPPPAAVSATPVVFPLGATSGGPIDHGAAPHRKPLGPALFIAGAIVTAGGAGFTIWSGIDAENNPGTSAVKTECAGMGPSCPAYQKGLSSQLRTNIALGATGGVAIVTAVVGIFFTQWSSPKLGQRDSAAAVEWEPIGGVDPRGATAGLRARF